MTTAPPSLMKLTLPPNHGWRIGIIQSHFNNEITNVLLQTAQNQLTNYNVPFEVAHVAGCYEMAYLCQTMAMSRRFHGLIALGCLVRGETMHFELVAHAVNLGITKIIIKHHIPIGFGIIAVDTMKQAHARKWMGAHAANAVLQSLIENARIQQKAE